MKNQSYREKVKQMIGHRAGVEVKDVSDEMYFGEDLNLGDLELTEILEELEDIYKTDLLEHQDELESVKDLMDLLEEKLE